MDSRVTAENHPDDPFGMGTGPTYADRSFGPNQEVIARHNLRPLPWPRSVDLEDEVAELLYHFGIDDDWGPLREDRGRARRWILWILCTLTPRRLVAELRLCKRGRVRGSLLRQGLR